ncbi:hypothetical protein [Maribacter sp. 6B07]|uniref:hypothetical protein n=1 Tax=Maribacter sp. 6B07 TaxID=2045442 RepID=UPI0015D46D9A|nr:hypothetical protein [Maribacter sp. 6B07]
MQIEIIPEFANGGYSLSWNDTLYQTQFRNDVFLLENRPQELYCYVFNNKKDTLGFYRGLSSPRQWTYFQTRENTDSIINLKFLVGTNHFSEFLFEQSQEYIEKFNENNRERIEFKPIKVDLKTDLRKKLDIELINIKN